MDGPQHYARAEQLLGGRHNGGANGARTPDEAIALAQVHATLAQAAATAEAGALVRPPLPKDAAWQGSPATEGSSWGRVLSRDES